jgi:hypothetical protein
MTTSLCCACGKPLPQFRFFRLRCPACGTPHRSIRGTPWFVSVSMGLLPFAMLLGFVVLPFGLAINVLVSFGATMALAIFVSLLYQKWKPLNPSSTLSR